ncbi:MAG: hypothetical protein AAGH65_06215, partial [Pseudomonadota bacterium]
MHMKFERPQSRRGYIRVVLMVFALALLAGCNGTTQVKYIYHWAGQKIVRPSDGQVLTAPDGQHYAVFLVNCVDN